MNAPNNTQDAMAAVRSTALLGRVLVGCEYSGTVRDAFAKLGWDAWSCDLLPTESPGNHMQCDVLDVINDGWDLAIFHPPCTHLASSGARWMKQKWADGLVQPALDFVAKLMQTKIPHVAIENPVGIISTLIRKPDQIIQPWQHGHECTKATCLWLKSLPPLQPTNIVGKGTVYFDRKGKPHGSEFVMRAKVGYSPLMLLPRTPDRWKIRSRTFQGIADAMANQWTHATRPNDPDQR